MSILMPAAAGLAQKPANQKSQNVLEYFIELNPSQIHVSERLQGKPFSEATLKPWLKKKDFKNGYLEIVPAITPHSEAPARIEVALFRSKPINSPPLLLVSVSQGSSDEVFAFQRALDTPKWTEVTASVLPKPSPDEFSAIFSRISPQGKFRPEYADHVAYRLPRKGTQIQVVSTIDEEKLYDVELYRLVFDGAQFSIQTAQKQSKVK